MIIVCGNFVILIILKMVVVVKMMKVNHSSGRRGKMT